MKENILKEFDDNKSKFSDFKEKMELLIPELLKDGSIIVHQIAGRVKERTSLEKKIERKNNKYTNTNDITDIIGVRIITYLESDVDRVAEILNKEFDLDNENSIDKRKLKSDQFGYRSLHYVVSCKDERTKLAEYRRFKDLKFEIQIRSMLQHTWAEIEHDLGYKGISSIPDAHKRSFNRVAALLESADLEFDRLKKELIKYESEINSLIENDPENVEINLASLKSFILNSQHVKYIDQEICKRTNKELIRYKKPDQIYIDAIDVERLLYLEINTVDKLNNLLKDNKEEIIKFAEEWVGNKYYGNFEKGISIFYLCYLLVGKKDDIDIAGFYYTNYINLGTESHDGNEIIETFKKIQV